MAAVALFSVSSYAQTTPEAEGTTTTEELTPVEMWAKVSATNPLHYFDRVTVVDEDENVAYADDGTKQIDPVPFKTETGGTALPQNASYFYVAEGSSTSFFALNKTLSKKEGKFVNSAGEVVDVPEDGAATEGALGSGAYMDEDGNLVYPSDLVDEVSWNWEEMSSDYYLFTASNRSRFAYYNKAAKRFKTTTTETATKAKLYKVVTVYAPYFKDPEGPQKLENEDDTYKAEIINPNEGGELKYRFEGEDDTMWKPYPDGGIECETGEETTIETKIEFEGGSTPVVGRTFVPVYVPAPEITAELEEDGTLKIGVDGTAPVTITSEKGTSLTYSVGTGKAKEIESNEVEVDLAYIADQTPNTTPVTGMAIKEVEYTPWPTAKNKDNKATGTVKSDPTTETFTVVPNATPEDLFTDLKSEPQNGAQVNGGQTVYLWFELLPDLTGDFANYEIEPNTEVAKKDLELTFKGKTEPVKAPASIVPLPGTKDKYVVSFVVPVGKDYVNTEFDVAVPEGFYKATSGKNVVLTEAGTVHYTTGLGAIPYYVEMPNMLLPTDATSVTVKIYPYGQKDAVVNFVDEKDPVKGVQFGNSIDELETPVEKIEKTGEPNTFTVTFTNKEGQNEFIQKWILNEDGQINEKGFVIGFPDNTFVSDDMANGDQISTHINFYEAIDFKIESEEWDFCEGSDDIVITVTGKGSLTGNEFDVKLIEGKRATIVGTDWRGNAVSRTAPINPITPKVMEEHGISSDANTDNMFVVRFGPFNLPEDYGFIADDKNHPYALTIPAGAFTSNHDVNDAITKDLNVMAHPVWAVAARPYTYDTEDGASTLTLDITATLDNEHFQGEDMDKKLYELPLRVYKEEVEVLVDGTPVDWELTDVVTDEMRTSDGMLYQTGVLNLTLAEPIKDVKKHTITIKKGALKANACRNPEMTVDVYPYVKYGIDYAYYVVPTTQKSVPYSIYGELPDGSRLPAGVIKYVGEKENPEVTNAVAYNNQKVKPTDAVEYRFPTVASTEAGVSDIDAQDVTVFTIEFTPGQLWVANFQMNFPVGTVQAEGYNANDGKLYNNFDVIPGMEYDATSSFADYMEPAKEDKQKEYRISTKDGSITLYLTAVDLTNPYDANANKAIELEEGTPLTIVNDEDGSEEGNSWVKVVDKKTGEISYTVTFEDGGLEEGVYTLTVPEESVAPLVLKDFKDATPLGVKNPEAFELKIYVEDFAAPRHVQEITTKTWTFPVPNVKGLSKIAEDGPAITLDGKEVEAACDEEGVLTVTLPEVDGEYDFLPTGDYKLVIPAGAIEGKNTTNYNDLEVDVKVIYEFVDFGTGMEDGLGNDLTTTKEDVAEEVGYDQKMLFTRNFTNQNKQAFAVPFDVKQADVAKYFTIYKIDFVKADPENPDDPTSNTLNFVPVGEEGTAYANKPYIIIPTEEAVAEGLVSIKFKSLVQEPEVADDIQCSTTMVKFDFFNTIEETAATEGWFNLTQNKIRLAGDVIPVWRWYIVPSDKGVQYIKIAINGFVDDADGIDFVEAAEGDNLIFNVAGQKLNTAAKGKVNIINGKKVLVK